MAKENQAQSFKVSGSFKAPLSGNSYEKVRPLHKVAGYTTIFSALIHGLISVIAYHEHGHIDKFKHPENVAGLIAGFCLLIMGISSMRWFVRRNYEGLHRTDFAESTIKINIFIACLWFTDRLFRLAKTCWNFVGNYAILTPMADGAVRVKLRRSLACHPGSHAFLWIPSIRLLETHPFTLISNSPSEFLIREYDGFTSSLFKAARENPGKAWRCSVDGGYGQVPDFKRFDRVVLVAGGSGATFTFSIASSIVRERKARGTTVQIDFIWVVRYADCLNWFAEELKELRETPFVNLIIYVTRNNVISEDASIPEMIEANGSENIASSVIGDIEKGQKENDKEAFPAPEFRKGRPDIPYLLTECLSRCSIEDRVGVGACGPSDLLDYVREGVSRKAYDHGPSIAFHYEVNPSSSSQHSVRLFTDSRLGLPLVKWKFTNRDQNIPLGSFRVCGLVLRAEVHATVTGTAKSL
ncbi:hypothetical protein PENSUB_4801 [Penicillium subrubescens]|uniref:FAD-binding FR-type domain-containing protein n=1 Tax=Penicillium subrubescens TaxID=1316194 RepID=A0A1Q5UBN6_9EURO|nr:hypothetical protein PENSUB_4801 [Penicillium subrubescens]